MTKNVHEEKALALAKAIGNKGVNGDTEAEFYAALDERDPVTGQGKFDSIGTARRVELWREAHGLDVKTGYPASSDDSERYVNTERR